MINETSLEACDSCLLSEELLFHLHSFTPSKSLSEQGTDDCRQPGTELAGLERGEVWLPCPVWSIAIELFILHAVYLRSNWDNWEYAEIELHSYEVLCSLEMTLACPKAPLPYFPSSVLLLAQVVWRVLPDLGQGQEPQVHCSRPQGELWHDQSPRLWIPVPQPSHSPSWLWFLYPFTQSLSSVSAACFSGWVSGDVLHERVNSTVREALQMVCLHQCRELKKCHYFSSPI